MNAKLRILAVVPVIGLGGCEWFSDFKRQPTLSTWEVVGDSTRPSRANPQNSVPFGGSRVAGFQISYAGMPATLDSFNVLVNPTPASDASIENGHKYYQINCVPCHGDAGMGDGPVTKYGMPGIALVTDVTKARSDGYLYGMIRNGRGLMPPYNRIEDLDRWDVVNYLRGLQGALGRKVAVGPLAAPGVTGKMLPGATHLAPTRPVPNYHTPVATSPVAQDPAAAASPAAASSTPSHVPAATDTTRRDSASGRVR